MGKIREAYCVGRDNIIQEFLNRIHDLNDQVTFRQLIIELDKFEVIKQLHPSPSSVLIVAKVTTHRLVKGIEVETIKVFEVSVRYGLSDELSVYRFAMAGEDILEIDYSKGL